jgi:hypothetical protein
MKNRRRTARAPDTLARAGEVFVKQRHSYVWNTRAPTTACARLSGVAGEEKNKVSSFLSVPLQGATAFTFLVSLITR